MKVRLCSPESPTGTICPSSLSSSTPFLGVLSLLLSRLFFFELPFFHISPSCCAVLLLALLDPTLIAVLSGINGTGREEGSEERGKGLYSVTPTPMLPLLATSLDCTTLYSVWSALPVVTGCPTLSWPTGGSLLCCGTVLFSTPSLSSRDEP